MKKYWMIAGAAVLVVGVAAPWAVGMVTEQQWQEATREVNASQAYFQLETHDYQRGYLGAGFSGTLVVRDPGNGDTHQFDYRANVTHGITGSLLDFEPESGMPAEVVELFPDQKPRLTLETRLWGTAIVELTVPAISVMDERTGESLNVSESYGRVSIGDAGAEADITLLLPGAVVRGPDLRISMEDFRYQQHMEHLRGGVWTGEGDMSLAGLELAARNEPPVSLADFSLQSETYTEDGGASLGSTTVATLETVQVGDGAFGPHRLEFVFSGVDVDSWSELTAALADLQGAALTAETASRQDIMQQQMEAMGRINGALTDLAAEGFSFGFPELSMATPEGPVTGQLMLQHPSLTDEEKAQMLMVMQRLTGSLDISLPLALAENHPEVMMQVAPLIKQGMMVKEGERLHLEATLEDMAVTVNGNVIPLPPVL